MKKLLLSVLIIFSFTAITAAEQQPAPQKRPLSPAAAQEGGDNKRTAMSYFVPVKDNHFHIEFKSGIVIENVAKEVIEQLQLLKDMLDDLGQDNRELISLPSVSAGDFFALSYYMEEPQLTRRTYLAQLDFDKLFVLIKTADFLKLNDNTSAYTDLIHHVIKTFTLEQLKKLETGIDTLLDPTTLQKALKKIQVTALAHDQLEKRTLESRSTLGKGKVEFCERICSLNFEISIEDICENETAKQRITPYENYDYENGEDVKIVVDLSNSFITSLTGLAEVADLGKTQKINFTKNFIRTIDSRVFSGLAGLENISLDENHLTTIAPNTFSSLNLLGKIGLSKNQLTTLLAGTFSNLPQLESLHLNDNQLTTLAPKTFSNLPLLVELYLESNAIRDIHTNAFDKLPQLTILYLHDNQITAINRNTFGNLAQLELLHLSSNQIATIASDSFTTLPELEELWLENNRITTIDSGTFSNLTQLKELSLDDNQIATINPGAFHNVPQLYSLSLDNNQLTELPVNFFQNIPELQWLSLKNNPLSEEQKQIIRQNIPAGCEVRF